MAQRFFWRVLRLVLASMWVACGEGPGGDADSTGGGGCHKPVQIPRWVAEKYGARRCDSSSGGSSGSGDDTLLTKYFCQLYYPHDPAAEGLPPCAEVRDAVISDQRSPLPTLSLGDPAKPALFFVHGWPDSAAEFASQFGGLCFGPEAQFYCIAATWQNFHPDFPDAAYSELTLQLAVDKLAETIAAASLVDTTLVIHDWGSWLGYNLMWQYPSLMNRAISFDIGSGHDLVNTTYQEQNAIAFTTQNDGPSMDSARWWWAPCIECATWRTAWPYYYPMSMMGIDAKDEPPSNVPLLFMWGNMTRGVPRESDSIFFNDAWLEFVVSTPHGKVVEVDGDHWFMHQKPAHVNMEMMQWIAGF